MLSIIAAICENNAIGRDNELLCPISDDLKRFKRITFGSPLIMGMNTLKSLPRVLPGRRHVVLTKNQSFQHENLLVETENNIENIIQEFALSGEEAFIIGGASVYSQLLPYAKRLYLTIIYKSFEADAFFPDYDMSEYDISEKSELLYDEKNKVNYQYITLQKK